MNTSIHQTLDKPFAPHRWVRSGRAQTVLSRYQPRQLDAARGGQPLLLDAGLDLTGYAPAHPVRLLGYYTPSRLAQPSRGLVLTLHGWEGCSHSIYNLVITQAMVYAGFDVFRLNLRDHGPNLHVNPYALNPGLFLGTLIEETTTAVRRVAEMAEQRPFYIVGASMGGNFALRLALEHSKQAIPNLQKVIAFNPAIDPAHATDAIDRQTVFRRFFRKRWLHSLLVKEQLYPSLYQFAPLVKMPLLRAMTEWLIQHYGASYGDFTTADTYFATYRVRGDAFQQLSVPTTIITAQNDPIIPVADFFDLAPHPLLDIQIHPSGGHVGFIDIFPLEHKLPELLLAALA